MRKALFILIIVALLISCTAIAAVNYQRPVRTISVEDDAKTMLVYYRLPSRVVVLDAASGRLLDKLNQGAKVVGASEEAAAIFPFAHKLGATAFVDPLSIVALRPDLVVLGKDASGLAEILRRNGVNAFLVAPNTVEQLLSGITRLGRLAGVEAQSTTMRDQLSAELNSLVTTGTAASRIVFWTDLLYTAAGSETMEGDLIRFVGAINLAPPGSYAIFLPVDAKIARPTLVLAPQPLFLTLTAAQLVDQTVIPGELGPLEPLAPPKFVDIPDGFQTITWENIYARVEWLLQQMAL